MRIKIKLSMFLFIVILMSGCTNNRISENNFQVGIDEIKNVKANEVFEINGYLKNKSNRTMNISHGSDMFTYEVYDEDGNPVPPNRTILYRNDVGYSMEIKPNEEYRNNGEGQRSIEYYQFLIQKPGNYEVKTNVEFWNMKEKNHQINISSDLIKFTVE